MIKKISIIFILFLLLWCWKITPEINNKNNESVSLIKDFETCWIISCDLKEKLIILKEEWKINFKNLDFYEKKFNLIYKKNWNYENLIRDKEFHKFVEDFNIEFFSCPWDFRYCDWKKEKYNENEMNYIFYIFIPNLVINNIDYKNTDWIEVENIIQSIRRKDFLDDDFKNSIIKKFSIDLKNKLNTIDLNYIDKNLLKNNKEYFKEIFFKSWTWIYNIFITESQKINSKIKWISEKQFEEIQKLTNIIFYEKINELWINKEYFLSILNEENILNNIKRNLDELNKNFSLNEKILNNRFYRDDEIFIFNENNIENTKKDIFWKNKNYILNLIEIKNNINLLYLLNEEWNLFYLPNILEKLESENIDVYLLINLYEYLIDNMNLEEINQIN